MHLNSDPLPCTVQCSAQPCLCAPFQFCSSTLVGKCSTYSTRDSELRKWARPSQKKVCLYFGQREWAKPMCTCSLHMYVWFNWVQTVLISCYFQWWGILLVRCWTRVVWRRSFGLRRCSPGNHYDLCLRGWPMPPLWSSTPVLWIRYMYWLGIGYCLAKNLVGEKFHQAQPPLHCRNILWILN